MQHQHVVAALQRVRHPKICIKDRLPRLRHDHGINGPHTGSVLSGAEQAKDHLHSPGWPLRLPCGRVRAWRPGGQVRRQDLRGLGMRTSLRRIAVPVAAAIALSACQTMSVSTTQVRGYMPSEEALTQITPGSSQEQVMVVLGTPSTTGTVSGDVYYYISQTEKRTMRFMKATVTDRRVVAVYFDKNKRVERVANYGLQDGVVFDFVSRKTPTTGVEKSLLGQMLGLIQF
jgi:outer membrane protein assembly factor BamE (lipoprotein component of BamABCDE complex)